MTKSELTIEFKKRKMKIKASQGVSEMRERLKNEAGSQMKIGFQGKKQLSQTVSESQVNYPSVNHPDDYSSSQSKRHTIYPFHPGKHSANQSESQSTRVIQPPSESQVIHTSTRPHIESHVIH